MSYRRLATVHGLRLEVPMVLLSFHVSLVIIKSGRVSHLVRFRVFRAVKTIDQLRIRNSSGLVTVAGSLG